MVLTRRLSRIQDTAIRIMTAALSSNTDTPIRATGAARFSWQCEALTAQLSAQLKAEWTELANVASEPNIFQSPSYVAQSLPLLANQAANLIRIRDQGLLVGMMILRRDKGYAKLPVPYWRSALHYEQFLGTPLVRKGHEESFAAGLCDWLDNAPSDCSFLTLSMIGADGPVAKAIVHRCRQNQRQLFAANRFKRAAIANGEHATANPEEMLSTNRRKSICKARKKLAQQGEISIERLTDPTQLADWTAHFLELENTGWKRKEGSSILSCEHETALYKAIIGEAFEAGNLHFSRLCLDNGPIAYTLDISAPPVAYCLKSAIDQDFRKFSPGVLMEFETLKHYLTAQDAIFVDSCSAPDNTMLNELWPDQKSVLDLVIERKGLIYTLIFRAVQAIKMLLKTASRV